MLMNAIRAGAIVSNRFVEQFEVVALRAGIRDYRIEMKRRLCSRLRGRGAPPRSAPQARPCDARSLRKTRARRERPRNQRPSARIDREQIVDLVGLGLEFEQQVVARGEILDQVAADAGKRIERERIGQLPGADAEARVPARGASRRSSSSKALGVVGINLEAGIVGDDIPAESSSCNPSGSSTRASAPGSRSRRTSAEPAGQPIRNAPR